MGHGAKCRAKLAEQAEEVMEITKQDEEHQPEQMEDVDAGDAAYGAGNHGAAEEAGPLQVACSFCLLSNEQCFQRLDSLCITPGAQSGLSLEWLLKLANKGHALHLPHSSPRKWGLQGHERDVKEGSTHCASEDRSGSYPTLQII